MAQRDVQVGQKYRKINSPLVWRVLSLFEDGEGIVHARMAKMGEDTAVKTISVSALADQKLFQPVDEP